MLQNIAPNLWIHNGTFTSWGLKGSTRTTIIRLKNNNLLIHSPLSFTPEEHAELTTLGQVTYILAPNAMHYLYFEEFLAHHPQAQGYVTQALIRKKPAFQKYPLITTLQAQLENELLMEDCPSHKIGEVLLYHKPSQTLITSDFFYNLQPENHPFEKAVMRTLGAYGKPCVPCYHRISITDKARLRQSLKTIAEWPFQRIIMAHGRIIESQEAPHIFHHAWRWL